MLSPMLTLTTRLTRTDSSLAAKRKKRRGTDVPLARERACTWKEGERSLTVLPGVRSWSEDVQVVVQASLVETGLVGLGFFLPGQSGASKHICEK